MSDPAQEYRRLGRSGRRSAGIIVPSRVTSTLWEGPDHLLLVDSHQGFRETYKRFYYRDIQALIVRRTDSRRNWLWFNGLVFGLFAGPALAVDEPILAWVLWVLAAFFLLLFLVNVAAGATCITHLRTAVQTEELPPLNRLRKARKLVPAIRALVEQHQGAMAAETLPAEMGHVMTRQATGAAPASSGKAAVKRYSGPIHWVLALLLVADGGVTGLHIFYHPVGLLAFGSLLGMAAIVITVIALVKQQGTDLLPSLRVWTGCVAAYMIMMTLCGYAWFMVVNVSNPDAAANEWRMLQMMSEMEPMQEPWLFWMLTLSSAASFVLGLIGLLFWKRFSRSTAAPQPGPEIPTLQS